MMNQCGGSHAGQQEVASHVIHFWGHLHIPLGAVDAYGWDNITSFVLFSKHPVPSLTVACCIPVPGEVKGSPLLQYGRVKSPGFFFLQRLSHQELFFSSSPSGTLNKSDFQKSSRL